MSFNEEKIINIKDFLEQLYKRLKAKGDSGALIFYEVFLQNSLVDKLKATGQSVPNWDGSVNAGDFNFIYPFAVDILFDALPAGVNPNTLKTQILSGYTNKEIKKV